MSILIVGATGKQGGAAASYILSQQSSYKIKFTTRNPSSPSSQALVQKGLEPVKADLLDKASLSSALAGVDRAFLVTDAGAGEEKEGDQGVNFVDAAKQAGVSHVVFTSVSSSEKATNVPHFRSKRRVEEHLMASGLSYTILRPVAFMDNIPKQPGLARFMVGGMFYSAIGWNPCQLVAVRDIGIFAGKALLQPIDPLFHNKSIELSGGNYGLGELSKAIKASQGHDPWFARYMTRGVRRLLPHDFREMMIFLDTQGYPNIDVAELKKIHPGMMSAEDYFKIE